jgi:hypothetical protein
MGIKFHKPPQNEGNIKMTIHFNGKTGFSEAAVKMLNIDETSYIMLGYDDTNKQKGIEYLAALSTKDETAYKLHKAGKYYYLNTKRLYDGLNYEYTKKKYIFDIVDANQSYNGIKLYKLNMREIDRKNSDF